ncbi:MAG: DUF1385 domain-containing protein [Fusobacteriaceae bacterium]|jgi:uncharacterized protein YqhQ|nr:DUF1385 domain-containing protein [Fusobacteriaceae bacterium]
MSNRVTIGGQAVIEGVMMRSPKWIATAVRKPSGEIVYKKTKISDQMNKMSKIPFIRGTFSLFEALVIGVKELTFSASQADENEENLTQKQAVLATVFSLCLGVLFFIALPSVIGSLFIKNNKLFSNLFEALLRLTLFVFYIWIITLYKDIRRVYEYHGAEHKSIAAYEHFAELKPENAKRYTKLHVRCGTSFLLTVMLTAIIVFSAVDFIIPTPTGHIMRILQKTSLRILLMPIIAGISYELQRYSSKHLDNKIVKFLVSPGLLLQKITTKEPDLSQLEVAIVAIKVSLEEDVDNAREIFETNK